MQDVLEAWRPVVDEAIEDYLPRTVDEEYLATFFGDPPYEYDADAIQTALADPVWATLDSGGKRWRAILFLVIVEALGEDHEEFLPYAVIPEILHNGTLIVDDVEDQARMRRGQEALHHVFGQDLALNAGNALYFLPLKIIDRNSADLDPALRLRAYEMLTYEFNRTHLGQGMDIHWHNQREITASEQQYYEMSACKTGCLVRIVARLAAIVTDQPEETERALARFAEDMSIAFQIGDDILDVEHTLDRAGDFGKAHGNDIREGKKSLMVIYAAANSSPADADRLEEILWTDDNTDAEIREAIDILQAAGAVEYASERARTLAERARGHLDDLALEPEPDEHLREFTRFVIEREA